MSGPSTFGIMAGAAILMLSLVGLLANAFGIPYDFTSQAIAAVIGGFIGFQFRIRST